MFAHTGMCMRLEYCKLTRYFIKLSLHISYRLQYIPFFLAFLLRCNLTIIKLTSFFFCFFVFFFTLQYSIGFAIHQHASTTGVHVFLRIPWTARKSNQSIWKEINMNLPRAPHPETPSHLPPHAIPLGHPRLQYFQGWRLEQTTTRAFSGLFHCFVFFFTH